MLLIRGVAYRGPSPVLFFAEKQLFLNEGDSYKVENLSGNLLENGERKAILEMICIGQDLTDFTHINISHVGGNNYLVYRILYTVYCIR